MLTKIRYVDFWSSGRPDPARKKQMKRCKRQGGTFWHLLPLEMLSWFIERCRTLEGSYHSSVRQKESEKLEREGEPRAEPSWRSCAGWRNSTWNHLSSTSFKVAPWEFLIQFSIFIYWNIKNVEHLFYFTKKDSVLGVLNKVFITVCEHSFLPEMF